MRSYLWIFARPQAAHSTGRHRSEPPRADNRPPVEMAAKRAAIATMPIVRMTPVDQPHSLCFAKQEFGGDRLSRRQIKSPPGTHIRPIHGPIARRKRVEADAVISNTGKDNGPQLAIGVAFRIVDARRVRLNARPSPPRTAAGQFR